MVPFSGTDKQHNPNMTAGDASAYLRTKTYGNLSKDNTIYKLISSKHGTDVLINDADYKLNHYKPSPENNS